MISCSATPEKGLVPRLLCAPTLLLLSARRSVCYIRLRLCRHCAYNLLRLPAVTASFWYDWCPQRSFDAHVQLQHDGRKRMRAGSGASTAFSIQCCFQCLCVQCHMCSLSRLTLWQLALDNAFCLVFKVPGIRWLPAGQARVGLRMSPAWHQFSRLNSPCKYGENNYVAMSVPWQCSSLPHIYVAGPINGVSYWPREWGYI